MGHPTSREDVTGGAPLLADVARSGDLAASPFSSGGNGTSAVEKQPKKRLNPIKRKQMEDRITELEEEINRTEDGIARLETALQSFVSAEETQRQSTELEQKKSSHARLIQEWEGLSQELEVSE